MADPTDLVQTLERIAQAIDDDGGDCMISIAIRQVAEDIGGRPLRFELSWHDDSWYRVSVPNLLPNPGDRVEVIEAAAYDRLKDSMARRSRVDHDEAERLHIVVDHFKRALKDIRDQHWVENVLDPQWAARVAKEALGDLRNGTEEPEALGVALDALEEVLSYDKGMDEAEWVAFGNRILPFMHARGRIKDTVGFS